MENDDFNLLDDLMDMHDDDHQDEIKRNVIERAPFGYIGSKFKSVRTILPVLPYGKTWVEVFCGSAVMTLNRQQSQIEVINDRYGGVVPFYRCLRDPVKMQQMIDWLELTQHSREEFYDCRNTWCAEEDDVIRAAKWYYMIQCSVVSMGKTFGRNTQTPGNMVKSVSARLELFPIIHQRLKNVSVENLDFEICMRDFDNHNAVFYLDPPYINTLNVYKSPKWTENDLDRLLNTIKHTKGFVALSGYANEQIDSCPFLKRKLTWELPVMAESKGFVEGSSKEHHKDIRGHKMQYVTEVLWIKE
jgi:DNA adenine methylase